MAHPIPISPKESDRDRLIHAIGEPPDFIRTSEIGNWYQEQGQIICDYGVSLFHKKRWDGGELKAWMLNRGIPASYASAVVTEAMRVRVREDAEQEQRDFVLRPEFV